MKKTIYIISLIALCLTFSGCKKLVKSVGKETGQDVLAKTSKDALEKMAKQSAEESGSKYVGKSLGNQIVKRAAREKVEKEMEKNGLKSFLEYGNHKATKELSSVSIPMSKIKMAKRANNSSYKDRLMGIRKINKAQIAQFSENIKGKPYAALYKNIAINSYKQGEEALKMLNKENPQLYASIRKMMDADGPFKNKNYYLKYFECAKGRNGELLVFNSDPSAVNSAILVKGNTIRVISGCPDLPKGDKRSAAPNFFLDYVLPNKRYVIDGVEYRTDKLGRTTFAQKFYTPESYKNIKVKSDLDNNRRNFMVKHKNGRGTNVDDAGHIFQRNLGGINEGVNLVPMRNDWQRSGGEWRKFEEMEEKIIERAMSKGKTVTSQRRLIYDKDSKRPSKMGITVIIDGKKAMEKILDCP